MSEMKYIVVRQEKSAYEDGKWVSKEVPIVFPKIKLERTC